MPASDIQTNTPAKHLTGILKPHYPELKDCAEHTCINCATHFQGDYCPVCGQTADTHRFTIITALHNVITTVFAGDNTFVNTCASLLWCPGVVARDYICGRRVRYFRPIALLVRLVAVSALLMWLFDVNGVNLNPLVNPEVESNINSQSLANFISTLISNKVVFTLTFTILSVVPYYVVFCRTRLQRPDGSNVPLNIAEHFYVLTFMSCQQFVFSLLVMPLSGIESLQWAMLVVALLSQMAFPTWMYTQMYEHHKVRHLLMTIMAFMLSMILICVALILCFGVFYGIDRIVQG